MWKRKPEILKRESVYLCLETCKWLLKKSFDIWTGSRRMKLKVERATLKGNSRKKEPTVQAVLKGSTVLRVVGMCLWGSTRFMGVKRGEWHVIKMENRIWNRLAIEERNDRSSLLCWIWISGSSLIRHVWGDIDDSRMILLLKNYGDKSITMWARRLFLPLQINFVFRGGPLGNFFWASTF